MISEYHPIVAIRSPLSKDTDEAQNHRIFRPRTAADRRTDCQYPIVASGTLRLEHRRIKHLSLDTTAWEMALATAALLGGEFCVDQGWLRHNHAYEDPPWQTEYRLELRADAGGRIPLNRRVALVFGSKFQIATGTRFARLSSNHVYVMIE